MTFTIFLSFSPDNAIECRRSIVDSADRLPLFDNTGLTGLIDFKDLLPNAGGFEDVVSVLGSISLLGLSSLPPACK